MADPIDATALNTLFCEARSYDAYLDKPVSTSQLEAIWELMKFGPTSANCLPARIIWVASADAKEKLAGCVAATNKAKVLGAPVTAIIGMDLKFYDQLPELFPYADARAWFSGNAAVAEATALRNSTLQGAYLILAARAVGLDTGPMSGFDHGAVDAAFFADSGFKSNFLCTLGVGDPTKLMPRAPRPDFARFNTVV